MRYRQYCKICSLSFLEFTSNYQILLPVFLHTIMPLDNKEKAIAIIANAIAVYSMYTEKGSLPENLSMIDFILKAVPEELKPEISINLVDEVFEYVSNSHLELS